MRARFLAIFILIIFIGIPFGLYWYFYKENISTLIFTSDKDIPFTVILEGKLEYEYFPLLDKAFRYKSTCTGSCIFSPIPPLKYNLRIETEGRESIIDTVELKAGGEIRYPVKISELLTFERYGSLPLDSLVSVIDGYLGVGVSRSGKAIVWRQGNPGEIGVVNKGKVVALVSLPGTTLSATLDASRRYVVTSRGDRTSHIYALEGDTNIIFPYDDTVGSIASLSPAHIRTKSGLYEKVGERWQKNPRFTDYIDLSPRHRLGYIDANDTEKFVLANLPRGESLLILLDRSSGDSKVIKKGMQARALFMEEGHPILQGEDGTLWKISLTY